MSAYTEALCEAMSLCAAHPRCIILGQAVRFEGTAMYHTLKHLPESVRLEMPVAENMQLGMSTGIALAGGLPISVFPRIQFLLEAVSQLVQHLDKLTLYSDGGYRPCVIIRTAVPTKVPLDPGEQHVDPRGADAIAEGLRAMLSTVRVQVLGDADAVMRKYRAALNRAGSTILIEYAELYGT